MSRTIIFKMLFFTGTLRFHENTWDRWPEVDPWSLISAHPGWSCFHLFLHMSIPSKKTSLPLKTFETTDAEICCPSRAVFYSLLHISEETGRDMQSHHILANLTGISKDRAPSWHLGFIYMCVPICVHTHTHLIRHPMGKVHLYFSVNKCNV